MIRGGEVVVYRDDRDALQARAEALEIELQDAKDEIERLKKKNTQMMSVLRMIAESRQQQEALERAGVTFDKGGTPRIRTDPPPKPHGPVATGSLPPPPRTPDIARASEAPPKLFERAGIVASKIPSVAPPSRPPSVAPPSMAPSVAPRAMPSQPPPASSMPPKPIAMPMDPSIERASEPKAPSVAPPKVVDLDSYYPTHGSRAAPSNAPPPRASERPQPDDGPRTGTNTIVRAEGDDHVPMTESTRPPRDPRAAGVYRINQPPPPRETVRPKRRRKSRPR